MVDAYTTLFQVDVQLGRGAFGKVYKVVSRRDGRKYALKVIKLDNYQVTLSDVRRECNLMTRLDHRNILKVYHAFQTENRDGWVSSCAIQMEYCPNGDLSGALRRRNGTLLRRKKLLDWMEDLASALQYIHAENIIHRDLKPDNILLDNNNFLKISDFGIGKIMTQFYATTRAGTLNFVAPEVYSGRYNKKADIYSLGKVFICMATLEVVPGDADDIPSKYDQDIFDVIASCVEHGARDRPSADELLDQIEEL